MHRALRDHLRNATGSSEFVVAVNVDIRGFSSFFSDSSQAAAFLGAAYTEILDTYFPNVSFFKPTGDGLLLVHAVDENTGRDVLRDIVDNCVALESGFGAICAKNWLINFPTPQRVGIGIARNTATRLMDGDLTLDYSGYPLNLASRLMDLARPGGVVFDSSLGLDLLSEDTRTKFKRVKSVYIKGLADVDPLTVYATKGVDIPQANRVPFGAELFHQPPIEKTLAQIQSASARFMHPLTHQPASAGSIEVEVHCPASDSRGRKSPDHYRSWNFSEFTYDHSTGIPRVVLDYAALAALVEKDGCKPQWDVSIHIRYTVPTGVVEAKKAAAKKAAAKKAAAKKATAKKAAS